MAWLNSSNLSVITPWPAPSHTLYSAGRSTVFRNALALGLTSMSLVPVHTRMGNGCFASASSRLDPSLWVFTASTCERRPLGSGLGSFSIWSFMRAEIISRLVLYSPSVHRLSSHSSENISCSVIAMRSSIVLAARLLRTSLAVFMFVPEPGPPECVTTRLSERILLGTAEAISCEIMPPMLTPTRWNLVHPSTRTASCKASCAISVVV
mmetsp:Transcript_1961/g.7076  ORF Transcript_1961/g.7076 Transcript_1961/m.7076 type:complete len:209 (+) Transcript_1961:100-726(+)